MFIFKILPSVYCGIGIGVVIKEHFSLSSDITQ